jgi:putative transposase
MKAMKIKLFPNENQILEIKKNADATRYIYNRTLALKKYAYKKFNLKLSAYTLHKRITRWKQRHEWLQEPSIQCLQQCVLDMDKAYKSFFKGGGYPRFKSKKFSNQNFRFAQSVKVDFEQKKVYLPKIGWVRFRGGQEWCKSLEPKSTTVSLNKDGTIFCSVLYHYDNSNDVVVPQLKTTVGIDVGITNFLAKSDGELIKSPDFQKDLSKLDRIYKKFSSQKKGSKRKEKTKLFLNRQFKKIHNLKMNFLHHVSKKLAENYETIFREDLKVKNMSRTAAGTLAEPGKKVAQKRGLNRSILQQSWGEYFRLLEYKVLDRKGKVVSVDAKHTSQKCNSCGHVAKENRSKEEFECVVCGYTDHADINAARNIIFRGFEKEKEVNGTNQVVIQENKKCFVSV